MMVDPKELMIGNICIYDEGEICSPAIIEIDEINDLNPIPLSAEVLEACGFDGLSNVWTNGFFSLAFFSDGYAHWDGMHKTGIALRNLHQLQNLYFLLTGRPLEIDLQKLKNAIK